jgi:diacylglycerol kinase family enzyme
VAQKITVESKEEVWLDVDGEPLGILPIEMEILPQSLNVLFNNFPKPVMPQMGKL